MKKIIIFRRVLRQHLGKMRFLRFLLSIRDDYITQKYEKKFKENEAKYAIRENQFVLSLSQLNVRFYLPYYETDTIQKEIVASENYYEHNNLQYAINFFHHGIIRKSIKNGIALDIGANIGNHTLYFINECGVNTVHAFEPVMDSFNILKKNVHINELDERVVLYNSGVGSTSGNASIAMQWENNCGGTSVRYDVNGTINMVSIDDLQINENINLVKIDVEGFEAEVIKGMVETIRKNKPFILIEIREQYFEEIDGILKSLSYHYEQMDEINYIYFPEEITVSV